MLWSWGVAQWYNFCLVCARPWVLSLALLHTKKPEGCLIYLLIPPTPNILSRSQKQTNKLCVVGVRLQVNGLHFQAGTVAIVPITVLVELFAKVGKTGVLLPYRWCAARLLSSASTCGS